MYLHLLCSNSSVVVVSLRLLGGFLAFLLPRCCCILQSAYLLVQEYYAFLFFGGLGLVELIVIHMGAIHLGVRLVLSRVVTCDRVLPLHFREPLLGPFGSFLRLSFDAFAHNSTHQVLPTSFNRLDPGLVPITLAHLLLNRMAVCFIQCDEARIEKVLAAILVVQCLVHTRSLLRLLAIRVLPVLALADGDAVWLVVLVGPAACEPTLSFHLIDECDLVRADYHGFLLQRSWR